MFCLRRNWSFSQNMLVEVHGGKRKNYTPEEKVIILKKHLTENVPVSNLCDQYDLNPTVFYRWQKQFFEKGFFAFQNGKDANTSKLEKKVDSLEDKLTKKNEVLS